MKPFSTKDESFPSKMHKSFSNQEDATEYIVNELLGEFEPYLRSYHDCHMERGNYPCYVNATQEIFAEIDRHLAPGEKPGFCNVSVFLSTNFRSGANWELPYDAEIVETWGSQEFPYDYWIQLLRIEK